MEFLQDLFMAALGATTALAAVWGWRAAKKRDIKEALRNAKIVPIGEYPDGARKRIVGELSLLDEALIAPLSGRRCAAYVVVVDGLMWIEMKCVSFVIRDQTGRAIVHPEHVSVALTISEDSTSRPDDRTPREEALLRRLVKDDFLMGEVQGSRLHLREGVIEPGTIVAVLGHGVVSLDEAADGPNEHQGGYREPAGQTKVTITGSSRAPVLISDDPSVLPGPQGTGASP